MKHFRNIGVMLLLAIVVGFFGCAPSLQRSIKTVVKTEENARVGQEAIHKNYPIVTVDALNRWYPTEESEVIEGEEVVKEEEEVTPGQTIPCEDEEGTPIKEVVCPDQIIRYVTKYRTDTIRVKDPKEAAAWKLRFEQEKEDKIVAQTEAKAYKEKSENYFVWFIGFFIIAILYVLYRIFIRKG